MTYPVVTLTPADFPRLLPEIPEPEVPTQLYLRGQLPSADLKLLTIVGSRKYTSYGQQVVDELVRGLRGYPVGIVSGLALGIDSLAHEAALREGLYTLAILGGGVADEVIYPARHKPLARRILAAGGGLLCEDEPTGRPHQGAFPRRNRLQAGVSHATLLIEAAEQSGTLITARLATDYNRELLVVPGSIFSQQHAGIHQFLKLGATPVTEAADILAVLGIERAAAAPPPARSPLPPDQQRVLDLLHEPLPRDELIRRLGLDITQATQLLMMMELGGLIVVDAGMCRPA